VAASGRSTFLGDLRVVLAERDFRRLFATRLVSQTGDGIITAGVGTYVFFNASTFPSPAAGAAAFAALYLPYSLVGPFAGVFIDRWSRRQILVWSALLRSAFVLLTAALMAANSHGAPLYIAILLVLGVNRFFLSSLSVALPHTVAEDKLVMANSVSPTAGGIMATIGGVVALGLNVATGNTERGAAVTLLAALQGGLLLAQVQRDTRPLETAVDTILALAGITDSGPGSGASVAESSVALPPVSVESPHAVLFALNPRHRMPTASAGQHADPGMSLLRRYHEAPPDDPKIWSAFGTVHLRLPFLRRDRNKGSKAGDLGVRPLCTVPIPTIAPYSPAALS